MRKIEFSKDTKFKELKKENIKYFIIHHSASSPNTTAEEVHRWHLDRGWVGIGYHYFIEANGTVVQGRPETAWGAHCYNYNDESLGFCLAGNFEEAKPTNEQINSLVNLLKDRLQVYPQAQIFGHNHFASTKCPGRLFPLEEVKNRVYQTNDGFICSPEYKEAVLWAIDKGLTDTIDFTKPLSEEKYWALRQRELDFLIEFFSGKYEGSDL